MFGWVDHAAALDGFLSGMLYVPYALARTVARLLCPYCCLQWVLGRRWSRKDSLARVGIPITVLRTSVRLLYPCCCLRWGIGRWSVTL